MGPQTSLLDKWVSNANIYKSKRCFQYNDYSVLFLSSKVIIEGHQEQHVDPYEITLLNFTQTCDQC